MWDGGWTVWQTGHRGHGITIGSIPRVISLRLVHCMFPHTFPDRLLELRGLEQSRAVGNTSDGLVGLEYFASHAYVYFFASLEIQAEATEHQGDQAASAGTGDQVEVIARFGNLVSTWRLAFAFNISAVHEFLEENKHRVATNTTAICSGQLSLIYAGMR